MRVRRGWLASAAVLCACSMSSPEPAGPIHLDINQTSENVFGSPIPATIGVLLTCSGNELVVSESRFGVAEPGTRIGLATAGTWGLDVLAKLEAHSEDLVAVIVPSEDCATRLLAGVAVDGNVLNPRFLVAWRSVGGRPQVATGIAHYPGPPHQMNAVSRAASQFPVSVVGVDGVRAMCMSKHDDTLYCRPATRDAPRECGSRWLVCLREHATWGAIERHGEDCRADLRVVSFLEECLPNGSGT